MAEASTHQGDAEHFPGERNATCVANCVAALVTALLDGTCMNTRDALDCVLQWGYELYKSVRSSFPFPLPLYGGFALFHQLYSNLSTQMYLKIVKMSMYGLWHVSLP